MTPFHLRPEQRRVMVLMGAIHDVRRRALPAKPEFVFAFAYANTLDDRLKRLAKII